LGEARRAATIGAITRGPAHNLNNLLGAAVGYVDLVKTFHDQPAMVKKHAEMLDRSLMRIVDLIKQISYVAVDSQLATSKIELLELLNNAVARYRQDHEIEAPIEIVA